jgi:anti-sigma B factor antagonist
MSSPFSAELVPERETLVVAAQGELDIAAVADLHAALDEARAAGFEQVVLDLSGVTFIDSAGVAALRSAATDRPGRSAVAVEPGHGRAREILALTGVLDGLPARRSRDQALCTSNEIAPT